MSIFSIQNEHADSVIFIYMTKKEDPPNSRVFIKVLHDEIENDIAALG